MPGRRLFAPRVMALCMALLVAGCGARVQPRELSRQSPAPGLSAAPGSGASGAPSTEMAGASEQPAGTDGTTAAGTSAAGAQPNSPAPSSPGAKVVRLTVSGTCFEPGDVVAVLLQAPPRASFTLSSAFQGSDEPGPKFLGFTDDRGEHRASVPIPPTVGPGYGWVSAAASGADFGPGGGVDQVRFDVAAPGGC